MTNAVWIPVEYDQPEPGERVIATDGRVVDAAHLSDQGNWMIHSSLRWPDMFGFPVTHWMRMPEMPERNEDYVSEPCASCGEIIGYEPWRIEYGKLVHARVWCARKVHEQEEAKDDQAT
jgi:hypothetical protein